MTNATVPESLSYISLEDPGMGLQLRNLGRLSTDRSKRLRRRADDLRKTLA
jgi:hypothetical protein